MRGLDAENGEVGHSLRSRVVHGWISLLFEDAKNVGWQVRHLAGSSELETSTARVCRQGSQASVQVGFDFPSVRCYHCGRAQMHYAGGKKAA
jgi:hypothetical protein